jgi:hypothetical protein
MGQKCIYSGGVSIGRSPHLLRSCRYELLADPFTMHLTFEQYNLATLHHPQPVCLSDNLQQVHSLHASVFKIFDTRNEAQAQYFVRQGRKTLIH